MPRRNQPLELKIFALKYLADLIGNYSFCTLDSKVFLALENVTKTIPSNLWDQWTRVLISKVFQTSIHNDFLQYLLFGTTMIQLNLDDVMTFIIKDKTKFGKLLSRATNLRVLSGRYATFSWIQENIFQFAQSAPHLTKLQKLILHNLDLRENDEFFLIIGKHCPLLEELDISNGYIPSHHYSIIGNYFTNLQILKANHWSEFAQEMNRFIAAELLTSLINLKILEDDTGSWSCVVPALNLLTKKQHQGRCALLEAVMFYEWKQIDPIFTKNVKRVYIAGKCLSNENVPKLNLLCEQFPNLQSIDLRRCVTPFSNIANILLHPLLGMKIRMLELSGESFHLSEYSTIGNSAPNLEKLKVQAKTLIVDGVSCDKPVFQNLEHLVFKGKWNTNLAKILLCHSIHLKILNLDVEQYPTDFIIHNPLLELEQLILPKYDAQEAEFIRKIINSALFLKSLSFTSKVSSTKELDALEECFKKNNYDFKIIRRL